MILLRGRDVVTEEAVEVQVADTKIQAVRPLTTQEQGMAGQTDQPAIGDGECWVAPGLFDMQVNGFGGYHLSAGAVTPATVRDMIEALWAVGVTRCCPTVVTGSFGDLRRSLAAIADACDEDADVAASVATIHIEGPYISPEEGPRGAHNHAWTRPPDWDEFLHLQAAARGKIGLVTLAPEWPGTPSFIERLVGAGVTVSLGHHAATAADIDAAIAAGATLCTHLGNGAHAQLPRHPNYIWEQLARDELTAGIIPDGHHLPPAVLKCFLRIKGTERLILVSDASHLAGLAPGVYPHWGGNQQVELTPEGRLQLVGTPYLAGAALPLVAGLANMVRDTDASLSQAVHMATATPAHALGLAAPAPSPTVGEVADLVVLRWDPPAGTMTVEATVAAGKLVYQRAA